VVSKSKILLAALLPFLFLQPSFAGHIVDSKKETRRMAGLSFTGNKADAPKSANSKNTTKNQTANRRK